MKIPRNSLCPCGSNVRYKQCCGKSNPLTGNMMSFKSADRKDATEFDNCIKLFTGHYPDDYIKPIEKESRIFNILIDESLLNNHYAVSGKIIEKVEIEKNLIVKSELNNLAEKYYVDYFHFNEIFGRKKIFNNKTCVFMDEFSKIVKPLEMYPFSICQKKESILEYHKLKNMTDEQVFISLQWQLMFKIFSFMIWKFGPEFIVHMWREQENITTEKRLLHQHNIIGLLNTFPFARISVYRHYEIFMKKEILYSSLADLVAYATTRMETKYDNHIPKAKIIRDNFEIIGLLVQVFKEYKYIDIKNLNNLIDEINDTKNRKRNI